MTDRPNLRPVAAPERCRDLDLWARHVTLADDLSVRRPDGRLRVSHGKVTAVLLALRTFMDGPGRPDPGGGARPGPERLARAAGVTVDTVQRALAAGVQHGYLIQTRRGSRGWMATFAAALPPVDNPEKGGSGPTQSSGKDGSGPRLSAERVGRDPRKGGSRPTLTSAVPPNPHPPRARQLPIVTAVDNGGGGGEPRQQPQTVAVEVVATVARRLGLDVADPTDAVAQAGRLLTAGWTRQQLLRLPTLTRPTPPAGVGDPPAFLAARFRDVPATPPPAPAGPPTPTVVGWGAGERTVYLDTPGGP